VVNSEPFAVAGSLPKAGDAGVGDGLVYSFVNFSALFEGETLVLI
jgi:hypothetical protein